MTCDLGYTKEKHLDSLPLYIHSVKIITTTMEFLLLMLFLIFAQFFYGTGMPTPSPLVECKADKFYDEVVFAWKPCSDCLTKEGRSFERQCIACNCTVIHISERPTSTQSYKSEYYEKPSSKPSTTSATTTTFTTLHMSPEWNTSVTHTALLVGVVTAVVLLGGFAIFYYCKRRDAEAPGGCVACTSKPSIQEQCGNNVRSMEPNHVTGRASIDRPIPV